MCALFICRGESQSPGVRFALWLAGSLLVVQLSFPDYLDYIFKFRFIFGLWWEVWYLSAPLSRRAQNTCMWELIAPWPTLYKGTDYMMKETTKFLAGLAHSAEIVRAPSLFYIPPSVIDTYFLSSPSPSRISKFPSWTAFIDLGFQPQVKM